MRDGWPETTIAIPTEVVPLESFYVTYRSAESDYRRVNRYAAEDFSHAEEQARQDRETNEEIISIERDYKV